MAIATQNDKKSLPEIISFIRQKDYKGIKWLSNGSFGLTALLEDETINEKFVCKKYSPQLGIDKEKYYKNFLNEIKLMYKLNHKNVVRVFSYYMYEKNCTGFVLMEYIDGVDIGTFLKTHPEMINDIFEQAIDGFAYLENKKILHRDIRPTNILIDKNEFLKIIDFGFGKQTFSTDDFNRSFSSLNWWCNLPNDFQNQIYDFKTEIYFVGKLFEKLIKDNDITGFKYNTILFQMCITEPQNRISTFEAIKRSIQSNEIIDNIFDEHEINIYQNFAISLSDIISCVDKDIKYFEDIEIIQKKLSDLYRNVMLEESIPQNTSIIRCFLDGTYKFWPQREFKTSILKDFLKFFKGCSKDKKNIVLNNLHSRFDSINRIEDDLLSEEDIPF
ncbi:MAG: protein kinase family protein [Clostridiales bacterium]|nr:protein kinase family protein [Clostridiales bacterium]